ncbi:MAG: MotA/TolQ/ExbB proton channel family protein [Phycisphaerae bacterium]
MISKSRTLLLVFLLVALFWAAVPVWAQSADAPPAGASDLRWFDHFVVAGGWITWAILLPLSVATVALAVYHAVGIRRATMLPPEAQQHITKLLAEKRYTDAVGFAAEDPSILAYALNAGLLEAGRGFAAMQRAVTEALEDRSARLMRKIEYLNVIGSIAPMIGLFGTVYGMIRLFASIRAAGAIPEPAKIADDISIALVTTFWGLAIAIPALSIFAVFRNRIDVLIAECALVADKLLAVFKPGPEPAGRPAPAQAPPPPQQPVPLA